MKTLAVIGCGGGGGWLVQLLSKSDLPAVHPVLVDGDTVESKNLNRQMFTRREIGKKKAEVMAHLIGAEPYGEYLAHGSESYNRLMGVTDDLFVACCVDNHPARRLCLQLADERYSFGRQTTVVIAANEYEGASAQVYRPQWQDTANDPRVMFPEIMTDNEGDPLTPPCSGEALASSPQLALSNMLSASSAAWLLRFWMEVLPTFTELPETDFDLVKGTFPVRVDFTAGRQKTYTYGGN